MVYIETAIAQKLEAHSNGLLKGHFIFSKEYDNKNLVKQFEKPAPRSHNITYIMTDRKDLKQQYYDIRQAVYKDAYNDSNVGEDYIDHVSKIFVAKAGVGNVIGGIRLTVSTPAEPQILPIENCGVNLRELFPEIDFNNVVYGEATRLTVLPDYRDGEVSLKLQMTSKEYLVKEMGAEIGFGCSTLANTKKFKKFFSFLGYNFIIRADQRINIETSDAELYLWAIDFTKDRRFTKFLEASETVAEISDVADLQPEFA